MTLDRDQIRQRWTLRRDRAPNEVARREAEDCLALLTELEETETSQKRWELTFYEAAERLGQAEHRLAKTPALVEAARTLTQLVDRFGLTPDVENLVLLSSDPTPLQLLADYDTAMFQLREARAAWEAE